MKQLVILITILILLIILPQIVGAYYVNLLILMLIYAIFAMSLNLLMGYLSLPSLGHAAFFGVSAYTIAIFYTKIGIVSYWLIFPLSVAMAGLLAAIFGLLVLRTRGTYFFMITLALAQVVWAIAHSWRSFTGADDGISGISRHYLNFLPWPMGEATVFVYFVLFFFVLALTLMYIFVHSPFGHIMLGVRENEVRMRSLGYNVWLYKYICYVVSGLFAGLAGNLFVYYSGFVSPANLSFRVSAAGLIMVLLGGSGSFFGPAIGGAIVVFLENIISGYTERWLVILGILYVIVVMFAPEGISGLLNKLGKRERLGSENSSN